jgi:hypothetical protein
MDLQEEVANPALLANSVRTPPLIVERCRSGRTLILKKREAATALINTCGVDLTLPAVTLS